jgi:hypothetical protein
MYIYPSPNKHNPMKKLILLTVVSLIFVSAKAQVQQITVNNNQNCDVYFVLEGCPNASGCSNGNVSVQYTFVAGQTQTFDGTAIGLAAGDNIVIANIPDADFNVGCSPITTWQVTDACWSAISSVTYTVLNNSCLPCGSIMAVWTSTSPTTATLDFW